jgi:hypothetical protein
VGLSYVYSKKITLRQAFELGESYGRLIETTKAEREIIDAERRKQQEAEDNS